MSIFSAATTAPVQAEEPTVKLFRSTLLSCKYIFSKGTVANFVNGKYATSNLGEIAELEEQISQGHQHIYVRKGEETIDYDVTDPLAELRKKFFAEFQAAESKRAAEQADGREMGSYDQTKLKAANTTDIQAVTVGSGKMK